MRQTLLLAYLVMSVIVGHRLAPAWQNDPALWQRTVAVAPHHARAMVNLADAWAKRSIVKFHTVIINTSGFPASAAEILTVPDEEPTPEMQKALILAWDARRHVKGDGILPERERRTILLAADSDLVSILIAWQKSVVQIQPLDRTDIIAVASAPAKTELITELLEEIWQLQSAAAPKP